MSAAIKVEGISKKYRLGKIGSADLRYAMVEWLDQLRGKGSQTKKRDFWALKNVSFEVKEGEVLGIIGRNGAGKSTLLKILSRITPPTSGRIELNGRVASLLEVGTGFHQELTGRENIYLNGALLGMPRAEIKQKFDEIVAFSGVEQFIDTPVKRYSSGMYVRLAFAVAAHLEAEILLIDEVLAVGDMEFQRKCLGKMDDVAKSGRTVLFVSHNMTLLKSICQNSILIEAKSILFEGPTEECLTKYHNIITDTINIPLKDRKDRKGNGYFRFQDIYICDSTNTRIKNISGGELIQFFILYKIINPEQKNITIRLEILNMYHEVILILNNRLTEGPFNSIPEKGIFICKVPNIPLNAGEFYVNVKGLANFTVCDEIDNCLSFHINKGNFYATGLLPSYEKGILINQEWQVLKREVSNY